MLVRRPLQVWSAGCATGEEVYSAAILLDKQFPGFQFTIHATDMDNDALLKAQRSEYSPLAIKEVPRDVQDRYFDFTGGYVVVKEQVKNLVCFEFHDLVLDELLKGVDLILCRNVVIYFERPLQEKVFMDFYNSLNDGGYLFLGKAETLFGPARERFKIIDKRWKIYQKGEV